MSNNYELFMRGHYCLFNSIVPQKKPSIIRLSSK